MSLRSSLCCVGKSFQTIETMRLNFSINMYLLESVLILMHWSTGCWWFGFTTFLHHFVEYIRHYFQEKQSRFYNIRNNVKCDYNEQTATIDIRNVICQRIAWMTNFRHIKSGSLILILNF